jgi:alpha-tubulin suppressor-like RCC1 family protein/pimeloyl-ACP methyl ester carboxylesterase
MFLKTSILFLFAVTGTLMAQNVSVTGQIVDDDGTPVRSAVVEVQGTNLVSITNDSGKFSITGIGNKIREIKDLNPKSIATLNGSNLDYSISVPGLVAKVALVSLNGKRIHEVVIPNTTGKYRASLAVLFENHIPFGINLIQLKIGKDDYSWLFSSIDNGLKSGIDKSPGVSRLDIQGSLMKSNVSEPLSVIKVSKSGYFIKQIQLSFLTGDLGKIPLTRNKPGGLPVEMKLKISTDGLFSNPILVSAALDVLAPVDSGADDLQSLQSWIIDSSVVPGFTDSTRVSIRIDSSYYHPSKHSVPFIFGRINGDTALVLIATPQDVDTVDLSIQVSFSINKLRDPRSLPKKSRGSGTKADMVYLSLNKTWTESGINDQVKALANLYLTNRVESPSNRHAIIFVHGVNSEESIWDKFYLEDAALSGFDVFTVDYRTNFHISSNGYALQTRMRKNLLPKPFSEYESIVFVCHSMGGLVVRKALAEGEKSTDPWFSKTKKIIFFSTPHEGGDASLGRWDGEGRWFLQQFLVKIGKIIAIPAFKLWHQSGFLDLYFGYMNESDWGDGVIDYVLKPRSEVQLSSGIQPYATVVLHDEVVSEISGFNKNHQSELRLKPVVNYEKGKSFSSENAVLQNDGAGLLHSSSYDSDAGHDLFKQWIMESPAISVGFYHSLYLKADGTVWSNGSNYYGQLGDGTTINRLIPKMIMANVIKVDAGDDYSLFLKADGTLWSAGYNLQGNLGDSSFVSRALPIKVAKDVLSMSAGSYHTLILKTDGSLWATGNNLSGEFGNGTGKSSWVPVLVANNVEKMTTGDGNSFFIRKDKTLWATGSNAYGKLGDGTTNRHLSWVQVMADVEKVTSGFYSTFVIKTDGTLWANGDNFFGQLGDGTTTSRISPIQIMADVENVSCGYAHTLILKRDKTLWAMGNNVYGQLGDGTTSNRLSPVLIMSNVVNIATGKGYSVILKADGTIWTTGDNYAGQLGDGTTIGHLAPVRISF